MIQHSLNEADELLDHWPFLRKHERVARFQSLPRELMDNLFLDLDARSQSELVLALPEGERWLYIRLLAPDDTADLIQEASARDRDICSGFWMTRPDKTRGRCSHIGRMLPAVLTTEDLPIPDYPDTSTNSGVPLAS